MTQCHWIFLGFFYLVGFPLKFWKLFYILCGKQVGVFLAMHIDVQRGRTPRKEYFFAFFLSPHREESSHSTLCSCFIELFAVCLYFYFNKYVYVFPFQRKSVSGLEVMLVVVSEKGVSCSTDNDVLSGPWCPAEPLQAAQRCGALGGEAALRIIPTSARHSPTACPFPRGVRLGVSQGLAAFSLRSSRGWWETLAAERMGLSPCVCVV